jgi:hypothetical protein
MRGIFELAIEKCLKFVEDKMKEESKKKKKKERKKARKQGGRGTESNKKRYETIKYLNKENK